MSIKQGDIYWVPVIETEDPEQAYAHPHVVVQEDSSRRGQAVVVCAITSNRKRASIPGNILLDPGEANLPRQSVVEVGKVSVVDKTQLGDYIGSLTAQRVQQVLAGIRFQQSLGRQGS